MSHCQCDIGQQVPACAVPQYAVFTKNWQEADHRSRFAVRRATRVREAMEVVKICRDVKRILRSNRLSDAAKIDALLLHGDDICDDPDIKECILYNGGIDLIMRGLANADIRERALELTVDYAVQFYGSGDTFVEKGAVPLIMESIGDLQGDAHQLAVQALAIIAANCEEASSCVLIATPYAVKLFKDGLSISWDDDTYGLSIHSQAALLNLSAQSAECMRVVAAAGCLSQIAVTMSRDFRLAGEVDCLMDVCSRATAFMTATERSELKSAVDNLARAPFLTRLTQSKLAQSSAGI